ncbi:GNAT family N-acetyltransferase [Actinoplanes sp. NPDC051633]|uniref:GNAT family N-acetyltransferase n=1 Tax=Actinoplanes sp. NPDC051633 TaxID=3155670 RepID=UPI003445D696
MPKIRFVQLPPAALTALIDGDLAAAGAAAGAELSPFLLGEDWLWRIRLDDIGQDPAAAEWIARAVLDAGTGRVVGHGGFHGPPDEDATVEIAYTVDPAFRRRGYATAIVAALLERVAADPRVRAVRASIRPDNVASLATIAKFGFRKVGEQWDAIDGL